MVSRRSAFRSRGRHEDLEGGHRRASGKLSTHLSSPCGGFRRGQLCLLENTWLGMSYDSLNVCFLICKLRIWIMPTSWGCMKSNLELSLRTPVPATQQVPLRHNWPEQLLPPSAEHPRGGKCGGDASLQGAPHPTPAQ